MRSDRGGRKRIGSKLVPGIGWVQLKTKEERDYTEEEENEAWAFLISFFRWYPDIFLEIIRSPEADYKRDELIQAMMERVFARYESVDITGSRGLTKTYTKLKQKLAHNVLWPGVQSSYYGPSYKQTAAIAKKAFQQIKKDFPILTKHYDINSLAKDTFELSTKNGSGFNITAFRGDNVHDVTAEEYAQEEAPAFDHAEYEEVLQFAVRLQHIVDGEPDETFPEYQVHSITSAGRKQNQSFITRERNLKAMIEGDDNVFVMDIPWEVVVLQRIRPLKWAMKHKQNTTVDKWNREMRSLYTGSAANPIVRDEVLRESHKLILMEDRHCCRSGIGKERPEDVKYVIGYDVSYADGAKNAKCAIVVVKLTKQKEFLKRDKYLKQVVYIESFPPPEKSMLQAKRLKEVWARFCEDGSETYIAIDAWQYGKSVLENLMLDLNDGLNPLCIYNHEEYATMELPGAVPIIYPVRAGGAGSKDQDSEMVRYAEMQFENRNVELLISNMHDGVEKYKAAHGIRDDDLDSVIAQPYLQTRGLIEEIQNLKKVPSGANIKEARIQKGIQRDRWSALKYALWFSRKLEIEMWKNSGGSGEWEEEFARLANRRPSAVNSSRNISRRSGRIVK